MLNHSLPEMKLTPVPQDLAKRTTVVEEFSPQPKVIMIIHSDDHEYGLDVSELSDDDIDAISKLIGFAMKMKTVDDLRLFIAEHNSLQLIDEALHMLFKQIGKTDTVQTLDSERTEMSTFLQTHFPSTSTIGFSIMPYLMENFCLTEDSTPATISVGLRNLTDNKFRSIAGAGKSLDELVTDNTITAFEHGALLFQIDEVMCHFIKQLNSIKQSQEAAMSQETVKSNSTANPETQQAETKQSPTAAPTTPTPPPVPAAPPAPKPDNRSWYQRQNKIVKTVFAGVCVSVVALALYRKFGNKAD